MLFLQLLLCFLGSSAEYRESSYHVIANRAFLQTDSCVFQPISTTEYILSLIECAKKCFQTELCLNYEYNKDEGACLLCVSGVDMDNNVQPSQHISVGGEIYVKTITYPQNCADIFSVPDKLPAVSGVYEVYVNNKPVNVFCDMDTDNGGWVVFQRRKYGNVSFAKNWVEYKQGFGDLQGDFWLGNEVVSLMTSTPAQAYHLRVDLESFDGQKVYAQYEDFSVSNEENGYRLKFGSYSGSAGDSLSLHKGMKFTTMDNDNDQKPDGNCALYSGSGGFWYNYCADATLNGVYEYFETTSKPEGIFWRKWLGLITLKQVEMKFRPS